MTMPDRDDVTPRGLRNLAESFARQESVGIAGGLLLRLARFLGGDPHSPLNVAVTNAAAVGLPDQPVALSAVLTVVGGPVQVRIDGSAPQVTDPVYQPGTVLTLTGRPSLIAFRAIASSATNATLSGSYFT